MKSIIKRLLHRHVWHTIKQAEIECYYNGKPDGMKFMYIQECTECGAMREYSFRS